MYARALNQSEPKRFREKLIVKEDTTSVSAGDYNEFDFLVLYVPSNVKRIERNAFKDTPSLEVVTLHDDLNYIDKSAFDNCPRIHTIEILAKNPESFEHMKKELSPRLHRFTQWADRYKHAEKYLIELINGRLKTKYHDKTIRDKAQRRRQACLQAPIEHFLLLIKNLEEILTPEIYRKLLRDINEKVIILERACTDTSDDTKSYILDLARADTKELFKKYVKDKLVVNHSNKARFFYYDPAGINDEIFECQNNALESLSHASIGPEKYLELSDKIQSVEKPIKRSDLDAYRLEIDGILRAELMEQNAKCNEHRALSNHKMVILGDSDYHVHAISPDGNCLFNAIIQGAKSAGFGKKLPADQLQLRREVADFYRRGVDKNAQPTTIDLQQSWGEVAIGSAGMMLSDYADMIEKPGIWGSLMDIAAISQKYGINIHVFNASTASIEAIVGQFPNVEPIIIHFDGRNHYDVLLPDGVQNTWKHENIANTDSNTGMLDESYYYLPSFDF